MPFIVLIFMKVMPAVQLFTRNFMKIQRTVADNKWWKDGWMDGRTDMVSTQGIFYVTERMSKQWFSYTNESDFICL